MKAAIVGIDGPELAPGEAALLRTYSPAGVILFARNIGGLAPLARLVGDLREVMHPDAVLVIDQEGGRVARLGPPDWPAHPAAATIGALYAGRPHDAVKLAYVTGALIGLDCQEAGFDVVCAPVLDLRCEHTTPAIGDRSFGADPEQVVALAQAMADGLLGAGVMPVGKHAPGHGRARVDSHVGLPRLDAQEDITGDIAIFAGCSGLPWMMTAHIVYDVLDAEHCATMSPIVIEGVIRNAIGFEGVLVSDDLAMGALTGSASDRARAALAAGCDLAMHCSGRLEHSRAVLHIVPDVTPETLARMHRARALAQSSRQPLDRSALLADQEALLA